jgi:hypothetical protein
MKIYAWGVKLVKNLGQLLSFRLGRKAGEKFGPASVFPPGA